MQIRENDDAIGGGKGTSTTGEVVKRFQFMEFRYASGMSTETHRPLRPPENHDWPGLAHVPIKHGVEGGAVGFIVLQHCSQPQRAWVLHLRQSSRR
jgi:hypothetical protein